MTQIHRVMSQMNGVLTRRCSERGTMVLALTMITALLAAITSYAVLQLSVAYARQGRFFINRTPYRYAMEAGIVWAQDRLWSNPAFCSNAGVDPAGAAAPDLTVNGISVDVVVTNCGAGNVHTITALSTY